MTRRRPEAEPGLRAGLRRRGAAGVGAAARSCRGPTSAGSPAPRWPAPRSRSASPSPGALAAGVRPGRRSGTPSTASAPTPTRCWSPRARDAPSRRAWRCSRRSSSRPGMALIVVWFLVDLRARLARQRAGHGRHRRWCCSSTSPGVVARRQLLAAVPARRWCPPRCCAPRCVGRRCGGRRGRAMRVVGRCWPRSPACSSMVGWVASNADRRRAADGDLHRARRSADVCGAGRHPRRVRRSRGPRDGLSGLESPYAHLWSLPMRTLDPELADLTALLAGRRAADLVRRVGLVRRDWDDVGDAELRGRAARSTTSAVGNGCGHPHLAAQGRRAGRAEPDCDKPWL